MNEYHDRWKRAADVALGIHDPLVESLNEDEPSLEEWLDTREYSAAKLLLAATGDEIDLGYSEEVMSRTHAIVLTEDGLADHSGIVGMATAYTKEKPRQELTTDIDRVIKCVIEYNDSINSSQDVVVLIREKLDEIALRVNREALAKETQVA